MRTDNIVDGFCLILATLENAGLTYEMFDWSGDAGRVELGVSTGLHHRDNDVNTGIILTILAVAAAETEKIIYHLFW